MAKIVMIVGQGVVYAAIALVLGFFSAGPTYTHFPPDKALIKLSFRHGGARTKECRRRTAKELAELAPNMRKPFDCVRERVPLLVELELDGAMLYRDTLKPAGLSGDGPSAVYKRFAVPPGRHHIVARLRDSRRTSGFDYVRDAQIDLKPEQNLVIDFHSDAGGFVFR